MLRRILTIGLAGFLVLNTSVGFAETPSQLTLDEAIRLAVKNNPQLKAAQARLGISEADITTAKARPNPMIVSDNGIAEDTYRAGIEQTIELGGKRHKRVALAKAQQAVVQSEIDGVLLTLRADVRRAYTQFYLGQERQKAYEEILQSTEKLLNVTQKREQAGDVSRLDVLQADIIVVNVENELQSLANQLIGARNQLNNLLNQPLDSALSLTPPSVFPQLVEKPTPPEKTETGVLKAEAQKTDFNLDRLIETALLTRPEIQQNYKSLEASQRQLSLAKANRVPNLTLAAGPDYVTEPGQKKLGAFIIGTMELPVWNRQQGPIQKALAEQVQLQDEQAALKNKIILEVTNAYNAFFAHQNRVMRYETELFPKAQEVVEKSRRSFEEGKSSILVSLNAQQAYINTRLGYLQAMVDMQNAISDLERAVGTGL